MLLDKGLMGQATKGDYLKRFCNNYFGIGSCRKWKRKCSRNSSFLKCSSIPLYRVLPLNINKTAQGVFDSNFRKYF